METKPTEPFGERLEVDQRLRGISPEAIQAGDHNGVNVWAALGEQRGDASAAWAVSKRACAADPGVLDDLDKLSAGGFTPSIDTTSLCCEAQPSTACSAVEQRT